MRPPPRRLIASRALAVALLAAGCGPSPGAPSLDAAADASADAQDVPLDAGGFDVTPDVFTPDVFTPDAFTPDTFVPDTFVPDTFVPDTFTPDIVDAGAPSDAPRDVPTDLAPDVPCADCGALTAPRPLRPWTGSFVTSRRPTLRWRLAAGVDGARVTLCRDHAMTQGCTSFDATGAQGRPPGDLAPGPWFWRLQALRGAAVGTPVGPVWRLRVPSASTGADASWGADSDLNGDGVADLLHGGEFLAHVRLMSPSGPAAAIRVDPPIEAVTFVEPTFLGDYNGDGYGDFAVRDRNTTWIAPGTASGRPGALFPVRIPAASVYGGVGPAGDLDGDGLDDLLLVGYDAIFVSPGAASGAGTLRRVVAPRAGESYQLLGDVNGDGRTDLFRTGSGPESRLCLARPDGGYDLTGIAVRVDPAVGLYGRPAGDVDNDGFGDVIVTGTVGIPSVRRSFLLRGGPTGLATPGVAVPVDAFTADLDGDGSSEFYSLSEDGVIVYQRYSPGGLVGPERAVLAAGRVPDDRPLPTPGDLTGDGVDELLVGTSQRHVLGWVASGSPMYREDDAWRYRPAAALRDVVAAGDVDRDGRPDLFVEEGDRAVLLRGTPSGLAPRAEIAALPAGPRPRIAAVGDVDRDGAADLATAVDARTLAWWRVGPSGVASSALRVTVPAPAGCDAPLWPEGVGDVHGDGFRDVLVTTCRGEAWVFRGRADGLDPTPSRYAPALATPYVTGFYAVPVRVGDVNRDGVDDFGVEFMLGSGGIQSYVLVVQLGGPTSTEGRPVSQVTLTAQPWPGGVVGDVNRDGFSDVVVSRGFALSNLYYGGADGLVDARRTGLSGGPSFDAAGDLNGDRVDDLLGDGPLGFAYYPGAASPRISGASSPLGGFGISLAPPSGALRSRAMPGDLDGAGGRDPVALSSINTLVALRLYDQRVGFTLTAPLPLR